MSFRASIETNISQDFQILLPTGQIGGNALMAFLIPLTNFCLDDNDVSIKSWLNNIPLSHHRSICDLIQSLSQAHFSGDWAYNEDEFTLFQSHNPDYMLAEEEFKQIIHQMDMKWTNIQILVTDLADLLDVLTKGNPPATWWYDPQGTIQDIFALYNTLQQAVNQGASLARIKFS